MKRKKTSLFFFFISIFLGIQFVIEADGFILTTEEEKWVKANPKLRVGIHEYPPLAFKTTDGDDGYDGITIQYLQKIEKKIGIQFEFIYIDSWVEVLNQAREKKIDLVFAVQETDDRKEFLKFTEPYITLTNKIVSRKGRDFPNLKSLIGKKIALVESSAVYKYIQTNYPQIKIIPVKDEVNALAKVASGEVDATVSEISRISYFYERELFSNIFISGDVDFKYEFRFGVIQDIAIFSKILDKSLSSLTKPEKDKILEKWIKIKEKSIFEKEIFWQVTVSLILFIAFLKFLNWYQTVNKFVSLRTKQLREAIEKAEIAIHSRTSFLSNMSHEIRTPLNGVIGFANLLEETKLDTNQRSYVQNLISSANHLMNLINDILDFSKLQAGKMEIQMIDCNLHTIIQEILNVFFNEAKQKKISVRLDFPETIPYQVKTDAYRVRQILFNLISNAVKFTDTGYVNIRVSTLNDYDLNKLKYKFEVEDTGIGIPKERIGDLFKEFTPIDMSTQRKYNGTGLGLVISKSIAELLGGMFIICLSQKEKVQFLFLKYI